MARFLPLLALAIVSVLWAIVPPRKPIGLQIPEETEKAAKLTESGSLPMHQSATDIVHALIGLGLGILVFGGCVIWAVAWLRKCNLLGEEYTFKLIGGITCIILGGFLVVAGYSSVQMSGVMGLLGAVAGYIFGKDFSHKKE